MSKELPPSDSIGASPGLVARSASITFVGTIFQLAVSLLSGLIVARVIGSSAYGIFNVARTLCESATVFTKVGFDIGIVRHFGEHPRETHSHANARFLKRVLMVVTLFSLIPFVMLMLGGGGWLERHVYRFEGFSTVILVMSLSVPLIALTQVFGGAFRGYLQIRYRVVAEFFLQPSVRLAVILLLFLAGWRLWSVIVGTVLSFAVAVIYLLVHGRRILFRSQPGDATSPADPWRQVTAVGKYSVVISLTVSVAVLLQKIDVMMLGYYTNASEVGVYAIVQMIVALIVIFNSALNQAVAPMLARLFKQQAIDEMRHLMHQHTRWVIITSLPVFLVLGFFGNEFVPVFGRDFHVEFAVVALLATAQFVVAVLSSAGFMLSMTGRHMLEFYTMLVALVCNVALNVALIPRFGMAGAAGATLIALIVANLLRSAQVYRIHGTFPVGTNVLPVLLLGAGAFVGTVILGRVMGIEAGIVPAITLSLVFCALYVLLVLRFGLIAEDRQLVRRVLAKLATRPGRAA